MVIGFEGTFHNGNFRFHAMFYLKVFSCYYNDGIPHKLTTQMHRRKKWSAMIFIE